MITITNNFQLASVKEICHLIEISAADLRKLYEVERGYFEFIFVDENGETAAYACPNKKADIGINLLGLELACEVRETDESPVYHLKRRIRQALRNWRDGKEAADEHLIY